MSNFVSVSFLSYPFSNLSLSTLGLIHTRHFDVQYCDKWIFFNHGYLKAKVSYYQKNQGK